MTRIAQIYGYAVCLVAVITLIISINGFTQAAFTRMDPIVARDHNFGMPEASLTSFESYRLTRQAGWRMAPTVPAREGEPRQADTLDTATLRAEYEALREDRRARVGYHATMSLVRFAMLIILAAGLFVWHWRWLRRTGDHPT